MTSCSLQEGLIKDHWTMKASHVVVLVVTSFHHLGMISKFTSMLRPYLVWWHRRKNMFGHKSWMGKASMPNDPLVFTSDCSVCKLLGWIWLLQERRNHSTPKQCSQLSWQKLKEVCSVLHSCRILASKTSAALKPEADTPIFTAHNVLYRALRQET